MYVLEIDKRYSELANDTCCLSCGGAIDFSSAKKGENCVDLGSGRGTDVIKLAERVGENGFVFGIDLSEGMLAKAKNTAKKLSIDNVQFLKAHLEKLPLKNNSIDLLISNCTINHAHDKLAVWKEIFRVLNDAGRFVVSDIYAIDRVPERYKNDPKAVAECWAGAITKEEYFAVLSQAGFKKIHILEESSPYPKGEIEVASFTIKAYKNSTKCCN